MHKKIMSKVSKEATHDADLTLYPDPPNLDKEYFCPVCQKLLRQPYYLLPCLHTVCGTCLNPAIKYPNEEENHGKCPFCELDIRNARPNTHRSYLADLVRAQEVACVNAGQRTLEAAYYVAKEDLTKPILIRMYRERVEKLTAIKKAREDMMLGRINFENDERWDREKYRAAHKKKREERAAWMRQYMEEQ